MKGGSLRGLTVCQTSVRFLLYKKNRMVQKYSFFFQIIKQVKEDPFFTANKIKNFLLFFCSFKNVSVPVSFHAPVLSFSVCVKI